MNRPGLVVFDMIGTTVQASDKIPEAFATAFGEEGIRLSRGDVNSVRGKSKRDAIRELLTKSGGEGLAALLIQKLGWLKSIDTLVCNDDVAAGCPAPDLILAAMRRLDFADVEHVASVGDTVSDLEAGANAQTRWNIGVLSGAHSTEQLQAAPHTRLIDSVAVLATVFT